jgi:replicative DNA helicase Mcm
MVGTSMQDYQTDEEGTLDANISESGKSKSQRDRMDDVATAMQELQRERDDGNAPAEKIVERLNDTYERQKIEKAIEDFKRKGAAYEPEKDHLRFVGR